MSGRYFTAISLSMLVHAGLWSGVLFRGGLPPGPSGLSRFENSVFIDPAAMEAVKKARAQKESVKAVPKRPAPAAQKPPAAPKTPALKKETKPEPPAAVVRKSEAGVPAAAAPPKPSPAEWRPASAPSPDKLPAKAEAEPPVPAAAQKTGADLMANPKTRGIFTDYFGLVKARIQQKLREKCEGLQLTNGSVELGFVLSADGQLRRVYVMDGLSQADPELKRLAVESLKESAPFTDFPTDFNARQIAFNLTVYFNDL